jgi:hypothetical protein
MDTTEAGRQQAQIDHQHGRGGADTNGWSWQARTAYDAELQRQKDEEAAKRK